VTASGSSNGGNYSVYVSNRSIFYQGPGYPLPTGGGRYEITTWGMQKSIPTLSGVLQVRVLCKTNTSYYISVGSFGVPMQMGVWTMFGATIDTLSMGSDCSPDTGGLVRSATLYLNHQDNSCISGTCPDLYLDDLVVHVTDGHNLVGNPNFEAMASDGWGLSGGSSVLSISSTAAHSGSYSLRQTSRSVPLAGPRYALPIGAARYNVSFWAQHTGTQTHDLILQSTYTCIGSSAVTPAPIFTAQGVPGNNWTQVAGSVVVPPADAPAGCKLQSAGVYVRTDGTMCGTGSGQVECPDLYVDDVSVTLQ
jgi:Carbohydrate binding domain